VRFRVVVLERARDLEAFYVFREGDVSIESRERGGGSEWMFTFAIAAWGEGRWRWVRLERRCGIGGEALRWMR
jgi:hypothetical protein